MTSHLLHYFSASLALALASIGGGIGQGLAGASAIHAMQRQPLSNNSIFRALIIGLALIESGIIIALVLTLLTLFGAPKDITWGIAISELGTGIAIGIAAAITSVASSFIVKGATLAIARQPFFAQKITTMMLLGQSIIEAPVVFAFIIALLVRTNIHPTMTLLDGLKNLAACILVGLGSIGPSVGQALFGSASCTSIGLNKSAYNKIFTFSLMCQAIIETPMIFCLLLSLIILYTPSVEAHFVVQAATMLTAAGTLGIGSIGTAIGIGNTASKSCYQIAHEPENYPIILKTTLLVGAFIESAVIYAMIVALLLIRAV